MLALKKYPEVMECSPKAVLERLAAAAEGLELPPSPTKP